MVIRLACHEEREARQEAHTSFRGDGPCEGKCCHFGLLRGSDMDFMVEAGEVELGDAPEETDGTLSPLFEGRGVDAKGCGFRGGWSAVASANFALCMALPS